MKNIEPSPQIIDSNVSQKDQNSNKYEKTHLKKELIFDEEKNKYFLLDKKTGKLNETNLFGKIASHINIPQVGKATYEERVSSKSLNELNFNIDNNLYRPISNHFDGYSQFPRPLIRPFSNTKNISNKKKIINNIINNKYLLNILKNQKLFTSINNNLNSKLNYYTGQLSNISNSDNKNNVLKIIDDALNNKKNGLSEKEKKRLKIFKRKIINNSINLINGVQFPKPKSKFYNKFELNYNVMFKNPLNSQKDSKINVNIYNLLYKSINNNPLTKLKNNESRNNIENNIIESYKNLKENNKDNKENKRYLYKEDNSLSSSLFDTTSKINSKKKIIQRVNSAISLPKLQTFKMLESIRNTTSKTIEQLDNDMTNSNNNISQKQKNNNQSLGVGKNISLVVDLKKHCNMEKRLLRGYIRPVSKDAAFYRKAHPKYKSTADIYKKELDLLNIVNPKIFKMEEEKIMKQEIYLKRQLQKNLLEENNKNNRRQLSANSVYSRVSKK